MFMYIVVTVKRSRVRRDATTQCLRSQFWIQPRVLVAKNHGLTRQQLTAVKKLIEDHRDEIIQAWRTHFPG